MYQMAMKYNIIWPKNRPNGLKNARVLHFKTFQNQPEFGHHLATLAHSTRSPTLSVVFNFVRNAWICVWTKFVKKLVQLPCTSVTRLGEF
jgi:hypothetical protein